MRAVASALNTSVAELYALAEGRVLRSDGKKAAVLAEDLEKDAILLRRSFRLLVADNKKIALEIVKTLLRLQQKS